MYTTEHILAVKCQIAIAILAAVTCRVALKLPLRTSLWAVLLFNSLPVITAPGFDTPLFVHDLILPILFLLSVVCGRFNDKLFILAALAALLWPLVGTGVSVASGIEGYQWVAFAYRRFGFLILLLVGLSGVFQRIRAGEFLDACVVIWGFMLVPALLQYFGFIDTDIHALDFGESRRLSILESSAAQRGFLGLNRGAVGVWGSAMATYCLGQYFFNRKLDRNRWILYTFVPALSYIVILFSGTRTGLLAAMGGGIFVVGRSLLTLGRIPIGRLVSFWMVVGLIGIYLLGPVMSRITERFDFKSAAVGTGHSRLGVQALTVDYVADNWRAALVGMGASETQFQELVGRDTEGLLNHPHSEFVEMLWQGGFLGLALYAWLLVALIFNLRPVGDPSSRALAISGQGLLVAGMISGLAVGNMMITTDRLAAFGLLMAFVYGRIIHDLRAISKDYLSEEVVDLPEQPMEPTTRLTRFSTTS